MKFLTPEEEELRKYALTIIHEVFSIRNPDRVEAFSKVISLFKKESENTQRHQFKIGEKVTWKSLYGSVYQISGFTKEGLAECFSVDDEDDRVTVNLLEDNMEYKPFRSENIKL